MSEPQKFIVVAVYGEPSSNRICVGDVITFPEGAFARPSRWQRIKAKLRKIIELYSFR